MSHGFLEVPPSHMRTDRVMIVYSTIIDLGTVGSGTGRICQSQVDGSCTVLMHFDSPRTDAHTETKLDATPTSW